MGIFLLFLCIGTLLSSKVWVGTVYYKDEKFIYKPTVEDVKEGVAWGKFTLSLFEVGLDSLVITTTQDKQYSDLIRAKAAGYLEAKLTHVRVMDAYTDFHTFTWGIRNDTKMPDNVRKFVNNQYDYMKSLYKEHPKDPFYRQLELIRYQVDGFMFGLNENLTKEEHISYADLQVIMAFGDLLNIQDDVGKRAPSPMDESEYLLGSGHCSAIIKVTEDLSDILFAHNSWFYYSTMHRIFKEYNFYFEGVKSTSISFQSYPGAFSSNDDFLISSSDLTIIETTNAIFNESLFKLLTPESLFSWQRVIAATRLSDNGEDWCKYFSRHISGTYSNQFMILDMKKFTPGVVMEDGLLYIIEEMPGKVMYSDETDHLQFGYWPSYNSPFFPEMFEYSGYKQYLIDNPDLKIKYDYQTCARAEIMRRDQTNIKDIESMKEFIRYNDYLNDPLSKKNPSYSISSRYDLADPPKCFGALDATVSSVNEWKNNGKIHFISGPTHNEYIKIFDWTKTEVCDKDIFLHTGIPNVNDFDWYEYKKTY